MTKFEKEKQNIINDILAQLENKFKHGQDHKSFIIQCIEDLQPPELEFEHIEWSCPLNAECLLSADTVIGEYWILATGEVHVRDSDGRFCLYANTDIANHILEAKAACQAHHDALILARIKR